MKTKWLALRVAAAQNFVWENNHSAVFVDHPPSIRVHNYFSFDDLKEFISCIEKNPNNFFTSNAKITSNYHALSDSAFIFFPSQRDKS
ncbi:hypothetical protein RRG08_034638 [Elysia crispata]|uniref:Uncharacterized protein n=1 Tax=Elysia crispata TaxID=231223 RepID=A0AAE1B1X4_9GAST|nr:hypothetical protein RRG08_034638 [Elysia crispata]